MEYLLLFIILILIIVYIYLCRKNVESFDIDDTIDMKNNTIMGIIPFIDRQGLMAIYSNTKNPVNNNLIYTNEIRSNNWHGPIKNAAVNNRSIIVDLCYDKNKHLMCVAMEMVSNRPVYSIWKKQNADIESLWMPLKSNSKTIRSICYDFNETLLGISSFDGQIYEYQNGFWIGPINYDKPMKKIQFDRNKMMVGIGMTDSMIYRKKKQEWRESKWDTENINKRRVNDLLLDKDGKFLAVTNRGIEKQTQSLFNSGFTKDLSSDKDKEYLSETDILSYKCGIEYEHYGVDPNLTPEMNRILIFKKKAMDSCSSKKRDFTRMDPKILLKQNENVNLVNDIDSLIKTLKSKGY